MEKQLLHLQVGNKVTKVIEVGSKVIYRDSLNGIFDLSWGKFSLWHLSSILGGRRGAEGVEGEGRGDRGDGGVWVDEQGRGGGGQQALVALI